MKKILREGRVAVESAVRMRREGSQNLSARAVAREESPRGLEHDGVAGVPEAGGGGGQRVVLVTLDDDRAVGEGRC